MYAECSHWASWRRAFHTKISLLPSSLLNLNYLSISSLPCCRMNYPATPQLSQATRQISINNICNNSLTEKRRLTGCHELVGKVFTVRVGMITLVSEMRQNTSADVKESRPRTNNQGDCSLLQSPWAMRQFFWSTFNSHVGASVEKCLCLTHPGANMMRTIKCAWNASYQKWQQT